MFKSNNSKSNRVGLHCLICEKSISIENQGTLDLLRHYCGKSHVNLLIAKRKQGLVDAHFLSQDSTIETQASIIEVKIVGFLTDHNLPFATVDHFGPFKKYISRLENSLSLLLW